MIFVATNQNKLTGFSRPFLSLSFYSSKIINIKTNTNSERMNFIKMYGYGPSLCGENSSIQGLLLIASSSLT